MPNSNYRKGANFERRIKKYLESLGYEVFRTAGSKSIVDLIAFHSDSPPGWVQCKCGTATMSKKEKKELCGRATSVGAVGVYAHTSKQNRIVFERIEIGGNKNE